MVLTLPHISPRSARPIRAFKSIQSAPIFLRKSSTDLASRFNDNDAAAEPPGDETDVTEEPAINVPIRKYPAKIAIRYLTAKDLPKNPPFNPVTDLQKRMQAARVSVHARLLLMQSAVDRRFMKELEEMEKDIHLWTPKERWMWHQEQERLRRKIAQYDHEGPKTKIRRLFQDGNPRPDQRPEDNEREEMLMDKMEKYYKEKDEK